MLHAKKHTPSCAQLLLRVEKIMVRRVGETHIFGKRHSASENSDVRRRGGETPGTGENTIANFPCKIYTNSHSSTIRSSSSKTTSTACVCAAFVGTPGDINVGHDRKKLPPGSLKRELTEKYKHHITFRLLRSAKDIRKGSSLVFFGISFIYIQSLFSYDRI